MELMNTRRRKCEKEKRAKINLTRRREKQEKTGAGEGSNPMHGIMQKATAFLL